jgi:hypothetical protein
LQNPTWRYRIGSIGSIVSNKDQPLHPGTPCVVQVVSKKTKTPGRMMAVCRATLLHIDEALA